MQNYVFISCGELQLFTPAFQTYLQNPAVQSRYVTGRWLLVLKYLPVLVLQIKLSFIRAVFFF